jgi:hypothetical protein
MSDDALVCVGLRIYTPAWRAANDPGAPPGFALVYERAAAEPHGPVLVLDDALLFECIASICPPTVTIKSAAGEDTEALRALVEWATAPQQVH